MADRTAAGTLTDDENDQLERANASGRTPVVFVHGLWLLASSWDRWIGHFEDAGYSAVAPAGPTIRRRSPRRKADPTVFAGTSVGDVADHLEQFVRRLARKPAVIGHSFGGVLTQILAGRGLAAASVAIDPAPHRGVLPLPFSSLRAAFPVLRNPLNRGRAVALSYDQFRYAFANAVDEAEARRLHEEFSVAAPGKPLFQAAFGQPQPAVGAQGRHEEPGAWPDADHLRRARPHRSAGHRHGDVPTATAQPGRHRVRRDRRSWPLADDRQRVAGGRRHGARLRAPVHLTVRSLPQPAGALRTIVRISHAARREETAS